MELNENVAGILGLLQTDGCLAQGRLEFYVQNNQEELIDYLKKMFWNEFKITIVPTKKYDKWDNGKECSFNYIRINSKSLFNSFGQILSNGKKRVPPFIFNSNENIICNYLTSIFDADGSVYHLKDKGYPSFRTKIRMKKRNLDFLQDIQRLLMIVGIQSKIFKHKQPTSDEFIKRKENSFVWALEIYRYSELEKFHAKINFRVISKKQKMEEFHNNLTLKNKV